jgi:hypothetical protein
MRRVAEAERAESSSADKEHERLESEHVGPERESDKNAPDDLDDDNGCI